MSREVKKYRDMVKMRMIERKEVEDQHRKSKGISNVQSRTVKNNTGILNESYDRAEGSLNQHIKLKHPELVRDRGMFFKSSDISN